MLNDLKIRIALLGFGLFFVSWACLVWFFNAPINDFVHFVEVSAATAFGLILAFIDPKAGKQDVPPVDTSVSTVTDTQTIQVSPSQPQQGNQNV